uniref:CUB domain-containing protein n=1 Tax=Panagrolaimus sp. PS1159 TaxID=55785 RepID=A0AC35FDT2_9BILA
MDTKFVLILFAVLHIIVGQSEYDIIDTPCSTNGTLLNYNIYSDKIAQFYTPSFPKTLVDNETATSCQARFFTMIKNQRIWMALYNGFTKQFIAFDDNQNQFGQSYFDSNENIASFSSNTQSLTFELNTYLSPSVDWVAFQGVVIAYDPLQVQCPFSGQSIGFVNVENTLVIPISSDFGVKQSYTFCQWSFNTYFGQYLKIVIKNLVLNENVIFELQQSGKTLKKFDQNITDTQVYYITSDAGSFTLYYNDTNDASVGTGFSALISDTNVPPVLTTEECPSFVDENNLKINNLDYEVGYQPNQQCDYSVTVPENEEILVDVSIFHIEKNIDTLNLIFGGDIYTLNKDYKYTLTPEANNSLISFIADSSVQQAGFEITFKSLECICPFEEIIIPCESQIVVFPLVEDVNSYCDNMNCSYHISKEQSCSDNGYQFLLNPIFREGLDYFNIYSNGNLYETLTKQKNYMRHFASDTNITVEFISGSYNDPIKSERNDISDLKKGDILNVCSPKTDTLELFIASWKNHLENYILYDGKNFENYIGNLDSSKIFGNNSYFGYAKSESSCFTIEKTVRSVEAGVLLFRMKTAQSQNCENSNNIFLLSSGYSNFANTAKNSGNCEIIILSSHDRSSPFLIDSMNGTFNNNFILKSTINQNIFATINSTEISLWKNLQLYTPALSILLPPSTAFKINTTIGPGHNYEQILAEINQQKGIMASPSYSSSNDTIHFNGPLYDILKSNDFYYITAEFVLQSFKGSSQSLAVTSDFDDTNYYLSNVGEKLILNGTEIQVFFNSQNSKNESFLIKYTLNAIPYPTTPTTTSTTTTTPTTTSTSTSTTTTTPTTTTPTTTTPTTTTPTTTSTTTPTTTPTTTQTTATSSGISKNFSALFISVVAFLIAFVL